MEELDIAFGKLVKRKRKKLKITQEKIAELVGLSTVQYRNIEKGKTRSNWVTVAKICLVLELDTSCVIENYIKPEINVAGEFLGARYDFGVCAMVSQTAIVWRLYIIIYSVLKNS